MNFANALRSGPFPVDAGETLVAVTAYLSDRLDNVREEASRSSPADADYIRIREEERFLERILERVDKGLTSDEYQKIRRAIDNARCAIDDLEAALP